jgi:Cu/Ag efflux protein CusF
MKLTYAMPAGALMILALAACSGTSTDGGIAKIDTNAHTVTVYNGTVFTFDAKTDLSQFKIGDAVKITYNVDPATKKNMATGISKD